MGFFKSPARKKAVDKMISEQAEVRKSKAAKRISAYIQPYKHSIGSSSMKM